MGMPFGDITFYGPTTEGIGTKEYWNEISLQNFICDLYKHYMNGYKPTNVTRVCMSPFYHEIWDRTWKNGSLISVAPYFNYEEFNKFDRENKLKYALEVIHVTMINLSEEYSWDKSVFENAYRQILQNDFKFEIEFPIKYSRDKKTQAGIFVKKTELTASIFINSRSDGESTQIKLFDKKNWGTYDSSHWICKHSKWFDNDKFGIYFKPKNWRVWYSFKDKSVTFELDDIQSMENNVAEVFIL